MPRLKFPINKFRNGTVTSTSDKDSPPESPKQSHNVDPTAQSGTLTPLRDDDILVDTQSSETRGWNAKDDINLDDAEHVSARMDKMAIIDDNGTHRLVYYNDSTNTIKSIKDVWSNVEADLQETSLATVESGSGISIVNNNKEVHVGLGKDRDPYWVGIIENEQFGTDHSDNLVAEKATLEQPAKITNVHKIVKATVDSTVYYYTIKWQGTRIYVYNSSGVFVKKLKHRFGKTQALGLYDTGTASELRLLVYDANNDGIIFTYDPRAAEDKVDKTHTFPSQDGNSVYTSSYKNDITDICYNHSTTSGNRYIWIYRPMTNEALGRVRGTINASNNKYGKEHLWKASYSSPSSGNITFNAVRASTSSRDDTQRIGDWDIYQYPGFNVPAVTKHNTDWFDAGSNVHGITSTQGSSPGSQNRFNTGSWMYPSHRTHADAAIVYNANDSDKWYPKTKVNPSGDNQGVHDGSEAGASLIWNQINGTHVTGDGTSGNSSVEGNGIVNFVNFQQCLCKVDTKYGVYFIGGHKYYDAKNNAVLRSNSHVPQAASEWHANHWAEQHIIDGASYGKIASDMPGVDGDYYNLDDPDGGDAIASEKKTTGWFGGEMYSAGIFSENNDGNNRHVYLANIAYPSSDGSTGLEDGKPGNTTCVGPYFTHGKHGYVATDKDGDDGAGADHFTHGKINRTTVSEIFAPSSASTLENHHIHTTTNDTWIDNASGPGRDGYTSEIIANNGLNPWAGLISNHGTLGAGMAWGWIDIGYDNTVAKEHPNVLNGVGITGAVDTLSGNNSFDSNDLRWRGTNVEDYLGTVFFLGFNSMQTNSSCVENGQNELAMWSLRRKGYIHSDFYKNGKWHYRGQILQDESNYDTGSEFSNSARFHRENVKERSFLPSMMKVDSTNQLIFVGGKRRGSYKMSDSGMRNWVVSFNYSLNEIDSHEFTEYDVSRGLTPNTSNNLTADNFECIHLDEEDKVIIAGGGHPINNTGNAGISLVKYNSNGEFIDNSFLKIPNLSYVFAVDPIRKLIFTSEPINNELNKAENTSGVYKYNPDSLTVTRVFDLKNDNYTNSYTALHQNSSTLNGSVHGSYRKDTYYAHPNATFDYDYENRIIVSGHGGVVKSFTYDEDGSNFRLLKDGASIKFGWDSTHTENMNGSSTTIPELGQEQADWKYEGDEFGSAISPARDGLTDESLNIYSKASDGSWQDNATYNFNVNFASNPHAGIQLTYGDYYGYVKGLTNQNGRPKNRAILCPFSRAFAIGHISDYYKEAWNERVSNSTINGDTDKSKFGNSINVANGFRSPNNTESTGFTTTHPWGYGPKRQASPIHYAANRSPVMRLLSFDEDYVSTPKTSLFVPSTDSAKDHVAVVYQAKNNVKIWEDATASSGAHSGNSTQMRKFLVYYRHDAEANDANNLGEDDKRKIWKLGSETDVNNIDYDNINENLLFSVSEDETNDVFYISCNQDNVNDKDTTSFIPFTVPATNATEFDGTDLNKDSDLTNNDYAIKKGVIYANNKSLNVMSGDDVLVHATVATESDNSIHNTNNSLVLKEIADAEIELSEETTSTDLLKEGYKYFYKLSYLYDGYQEGPLSESVETIISNGKEVKVNINIYDQASLSKRVSHMLVYRAHSTDSNSNQPDGFYRLIEQVRFDTTWSTLTNSLYGTYYNNSFIDSGDSGPSFESSAQIPELLDVVTPKYNLSTSLNNFHFIADIKHPDIDKGDNMLCKSLPFQFDVFDITNDLLRMPTKPTALCSFNNRLYVFSNNATYRVEPNNFSIEYTYKAVGCVGQDSVVSFDVGIAWADSDNIYLFDGNIPIPIGNAIKTGDEYSWDKRDKDVNPILEYSSKHKSIIACWKAKGSHKWYAWMYNIAMQRWDMANFFTKNQNHTTQTVTAHTIRSIISGKDGNILYQASVDTTSNGTPNDEGLYRFTSEIGADNVNTSTYKLKYRDLKWKSNKMSFGLDGQQKKVLEIRVLAKVGNLSSDSVFLNYFTEDTSSLNLTNTQTEPVTINKYCLYKFKPAKNIQKSLEHQFEVVTKGDVVVDSVIIVYRPLMGSSEQTDKIGSPN